MSIIDNLQNLLEHNGFILPIQIKHALEFNLKHNSSVNKHFCFIVDLKTNNVLCYDCNVYFKSNSFPFSTHAEIQTIVKYYKSKTLSKNKKALIVVKLSKTGILGNSKCCLNCMRFIRNNFDNLNMKKIYYSTGEYCTLAELSYDDLVDKNFRQSKGFNWRIPRK